MNVCNFYILLWCIFNATFPLGNMISRPVFVIIFAITVYYVIYAYMHCKLPKYFHGLTLLLLMFTIYGVVAIANNDIHYIRANGKYVPNEIYIITAYKSLLPIFPFYVMTLKKQLTVRLINRWILIFLAVTVLTFYLNYDLMLHASSTGRTEFTNNQGNVFLSLLPLIPFIDGNKKKYMLILIIVFFILFSMKRGAIITAMVVVFWYLLNMVKTENKGRKYIVITGAAFVISIGLFFADYLYGHSEYFQTRFESTLEGNSSGRDIIFAEMIDYYLYDASQTQQVIGSGANATLDIAINYAHNDWLEILINNGILGIILFVFYWVRFYIQWKGLNHHSILYSAFGMLFLAYFFRTFYSMSYGDMTSYATMCLGYCLAKCTEQKALNNNKTKNNYAIK